MSLMHSLRRRRVWLPALVLTLLGLLIAGYRWTHEPVTVQRVLPMSAEARANPLHGLMLGLRGAGQTVELMGHLDLGRRAPPAGGSVVLLYPEAQVETFDQAQALIDWVAAGGRLVLPMPRGDSAPVLVDILDSELGVRSLRGVAASADCARLRPPVPQAREPGSADTRARQICGAPFEVLGSVQASLVWPTARAARFARLPYGEGEVLLFSDFEWLNNALLRPLATSTDPDANANARASRATDLALMAALAAPLLESDGVWMVVWRGGSLSSLLISRGWPLFLGLGLALLAWLLRRSQRFGPLMPSPSPHRRALMEHIDAVGQFGFRSDHGHGLHAAVRANLIDRLASRHALAGLDNGALAQALADRSRLPLDALNAALTLPPRPTPEAFRDAVALLSTALHRL